MGPALRKAHLLGEDPVIITVNVGDVRWAGTDNDVSMFVEIVKKKAGGGGSG